MLAEADPRIRDRVRDVGQDEADDVEHRADEDHRTDDGEILSETALLASAYVKPRVEEDEVADQDWMQLAWLLRHECPDLFIEMLLVLRAKARAHDLGLGEEEEGEENDDRVETSDTDRGRATPAALDALDADEESAI